MHGIVHRYSVRVLHDARAHCKPLAAAANRGAHGAKKRYLLALVSQVSCYHSYGPLPIAVTIIILVTSTSRTTNWLNPLAVLLVYDSVTEVTLRELVLRTR